VLYICNQKKTATKAVIANVEFIALATELVTVPPPSPRITTGMPGEPFSVVGFESEDGKLVILGLAVFEDVGFDGAPDIKRESLGLNETEGKVDRLGESLFKGVGSWDIEGETGVVGAPDGIVVMLGPDDGIFEGGSLGIIDIDGAPDIEGESLGLNETEGKADRLGESLFKGVGSWDIEGEADVVGAPDGIVVILGPDDGIFEGGSLGIIDIDGAPDIEGESLGLNETEGESDIDGVAVVLLMFRVWASDTKGLAMGGERLMCGKVGALCN
jgi:hypothetical protein